MSVPAARTWSEDDIPHIDVRGLSPPQPMVEIVRLIEHPATGACVVAHLDREPIFLYPELAERGWDHAIVPGDPGEVRLQLTRQG